MSGAVAALRTILVLSVALVAAACATVANPQTATLETRQALRTQGLPPLGLGSFTAAGSLAGAADRAIQVRGDSLRAPGDGTFSGYLRATFETELQAAGKYDPASTTVVSAELVESRIDTMGNPSSGALAARFVVKRSGVTIFDQVVRVTDTWEYSFIGAIAIPMAQERYLALYSRLIRTLVSDPAFVTAVRVN